MNMSFSLFIKKAKAHVNSCISLVSLKEKRVVSLTAKKRGSGFIISSFMHFPNWYAKNIKKKKPSQE
jgi:hypothetical protein